VLRPAQLPETLGELLEERTLSNLRALDFSKPAPALPSTTWFQYSRAELERFNHEIEDAVDHYGSALGSEVLTTLGELKGSTLSWLVICSSTMMWLDQQEGISRSYDILSDESVIKLAYQHASLVQKVAQLVREVKNPDWGLSRIWMDDMAPQWGSARCTNHYGPGVRAGSGGPPIRGLPN
jgi:hypothetical protein